MALDSGLDERWATALIVHSDRDLVSFIEGKVDWELRDGVNSDPASPIKGRLDLFKIANLDLVARYCDLGEFTLTGSGTSFVGRWTIETTAPDARWRFGPPGSLDAVVDPQLLDIVEDDEPTSSTVGPRSG